VSVDPFVPADPRALAVWGRTRLLLWPEDYVLVHLPRASAAWASTLIAPADGFGALVLERDEVSLTLPSGRWPPPGAIPETARVEGPFRAITLDVDIDLDVTGYFAPAAQRLAAARIAIVPQCAFLKDHLLVHARDVQAAIEVLQALVRDALALAGR